MHLEVLGHLGARAFSRDHSCGVQYARGHTQARPHHRCAQCQRNPIVGHRPVCGGIRIPCRVHPCGYQCRDAAQPPERRRDRHSGLSKPGRYGRAERYQRQDRGGRAVGRTEPDHAQGRGAQFLEGSRRQAPWPSARKLCSHPVHACRQGKWRGPLQGQPAQHHLGRTGRAAGAQERRSRWPGAVVSGDRSGGGRRLCLLSGVLRYRKNGEVWRRKPNSCRQYRLSQGSRVQP